MTFMKIDNLTKDFAIGGGIRRSIVQAVRGVSFSLESGKTVALVGESGSGKSTIARIIAQLEKPTSGRITIDEKEVPSASKMRQYRSDVQMVFQDPFASLNPYHLIGHHLERPLRIHRSDLRSEQVHAETLALLSRVGLTPPEVFAQRRPLELSGGQRQRVAIARALAPRPKILIADEPVSMLDVSIRLGVLNLLADLQRSEQLALLYITHDLATARHFSDEILVMYKGEIVERGASDQVILDPQHSYTKRLLAAAPDPGTHPRFIRAQ